MMPDITLDQMIIQHIIVRRADYHYNRLYGKYGEARVQIEITATLFEYAFPSLNSKFFDCSSLKLGSIERYDLIQWLAINQWRKVARLPACLIMGRYDGTPYDRGMSPNGTPWYTFMTKALAMVLLGPGVAFLNWKGDLCEEADDPVAVLERMDFVLPEGVK